MIASCLIIEDSDAIRYILDQVISDAGYRVRAVPGTEEALAACNVDQPDIIVIDWDLPNFGALEFLRGFAEQAPVKRPEIVLCMTEYDERQLSLAKMAGAAHYLMKPFDRTTVLNALKNVEDARNAA